MASDHQIAANRRNALRSTGPRTEAGRRAVSVNALKHGFRSPLIVLPHEDRAAFDALLEAFTLEAQPRSQADLAAVHKIAACEWRLRRLVEVETGMFKALAERPDSGGASPCTRIARSFLTGHITPFTALARYEASFDRQYRSAWRELDTRAAIAGDALPAQTKPIQESDTPDTPGLAAQTKPILAPAAIPAIAQSNPIYESDTPAAAQPCGKTKPISTSAIPATAQTKPIQASDTPDTPGLAAQTKPILAPAAIPVIAHSKPIYESDTPAAAQPCGKTKPISALAIPATAQTKPIQESGTPTAAQLAGKTKPIQRQAAAPPIPRNAPCPCGSGRKYKRCCGPTAPALLHFPARHPKRWRAAS
jgi:SEC-C motif-containing protein